MPTRTQIFAGEVRRQAQYAIKAYRSFCQAHECGNTSDTFFHVHHFLVHAVAVDRILSDDSKRKLVSSVLNLSDYDSGNYRRLRNHLEHFDERLEAWVSDFEGHAFFDCNIVTGATGFPDQAFLRAVDGQVFRFFGECYDLKPLAVMLARLAASELIEELKSIGTDEIIEGDELQ